MSHQNDNPLIVIEPVESRSVPVVNHHNDLVVLINALNPLGNIGKAMVEIMAYRTEAKRLKVEQARIKEQASSARSYINAQLRVELKQLENQRQVMLSSIDISEQLLYERRVTRDALISSLDNANQALNNLISKPVFPPTEIFEIFRSVISEISGKLVEFERNNVQQAQFVSDALIRMVGDTRRNLLPPPR